MKNMIKKRPVIIALAAILIVSVIGIPGTLAYFSDYDKAEGSAQVDLSWQTELEEKVTDNNKTIRVTNKGDTDVLVRVQVFAGSFVTVTDVDNNWTKAGEWWYYKGILKPGETTTDLFAEVKAKSAPEADFNVIVVHESSRTIYETNTKLIAPDGWDDAAIGAVRLQ